ncbi:pilus assembly protein PilP [Herminiimonas fonticola]|uniref:Type IV pilus assembly protein PilP n=1 Tax=Herminiimonas fonticola TaxID=303380 RepID=A0A4R6GGB4_9BURK|nr:pilus assembly protein PilP [Herminiimonas fonticola]RBA24847.1 Tfp pilus assembly protein PilP [Herminiimonas fonticola]TDN93961.1 type IV pilus assembly protein PilP [Herminiimonas fonticola]
MKRYQWIRLGVSGLFLVGLFGCGDGGIHDVSQWMKEVRQQTRVSIKPLSEPKKFTPFSYDAKGREDPYSPNKLAVALAKSKKDGGSIRPDLERRREALESYPLDNLRMVGTLAKPGLTFALLQADKSVFQVKVGNYIGQNLGMIVKITDTEVELKEIVQDASGEWVEREAKLELQETQK